MEELRRGTKRLALRPWVLASRRAPYEALVSLLARADRRLDALEIAEHLHARTILDARAARTGMPPPAAVAADHERRLRGPATGPALRASELRALLQHRDALVFAQTGATLWRFHIVDGEIASLARLPEDVLDLVESWVPSARRDAVAPRGPWRSELAGERPSARRPRRDGRGHRRSPSWSMAPAPPARPAPEAKR